MESRNRCYVNYLPVELLREVFIYLLPDQDWRLQDTPPPQLLLVQICSYWRNVALTYPRLWSTFMVVSPIKRHIPMIKLWLKRSGQYPLTLYIDHHNSDAEETIMTTNAVIELLRPHVHRWKSATFFFFAEYIQSSFLALPHDEYPLLETLSLDLTGAFYRGPDYMEQVEKIFIPSSSPRLRAITWETYGLPLCIPPFPSNIMCLSGGFMVNFSLFNALSGLSNLQTLRLHGGVQHGIVPPPRPILQILHRLHALELRTALCTSSLLDSITTPSLKILVTSIQLEEKTQISLCSFISRCRCRLRAFSYFDAWGNDLDNTFFEQFLVSPHMAWLYELNIITSDSDTVLRILSRVDTNEPILPSLNRLWLLTWSCQGKLLLDMLEYHANDFHPPTGNMMSEPLFSPRCPHPGRYMFIPVAGYSLCIQVNWYKSHGEVSQWLKSNVRAQCGRVQVQTINLAEILKF
ncbi:hypothetical protein J3R30DRAFT_121147 [Lentinula aciculospora]|uniref:F-box domain-containing protein n=1 Tax=Lentinula aciculospora TaxID=153920 RepID=A0A9W9AUA5_9AGAR|nr:hypothetical protein J3R30DRAFT_121147 [Lentinula aciculospora]